MTSMCDFSVVTATLNSEKTLLDTIRSVEEQERVSVEHIVKDGGSTDGTLDVARRHGKSLTIIEEDDKGIYDAMNQGFKHASGKFVCFLNSDDYFLDRSSLEAVKEAFDATGADIVYGNIQFVDENGQTKRTWRSGSLKNGKLVGKQLPHPAFFVRRSALEALGGPFDPTYRIAADFKQQLLLINKMGLSSTYVDLTLVLMRLGGASTANWSAYTKGWGECIRAYHEVTGKSGLLFVASKVVRKITQIFPWSGYRKSWSTL
jgi:glycosyltransferase